MENNAPETTNNGCVDNSLALKSGEKVSIYLINSAKAVFSDEELEAGIISPQKPSTRKILDPIRVNNKRRGEGQVSKRMGGSSQSNQPTLQEYKSKKE